MNKTTAYSFIGVLLLAASGHAATTSYNTGSLGAVANGTISNNALLAQPGALAVAGDQSIGSSGNSGANSVVGYQASLNPSFGSAFTIEFWANPSGSDTDDAVVSNRTHSGNRSGWVFFQRGPGVGWNFRMYNGNSGNIGFDITGGTSVIGLWSHVVAVWDGTAPKLYVNGVDTAATVTGTGVYNVNAPGVNFSVLAHDTGASPYNGLVDETAIYGSALTPAQIANHYSKAASTTPGDYKNAVLGDGALVLYSYSPVPEPASAVMIGLGLAGILRRRRK